MLNQKVCLRKYVEKYVENETFNSNFHQKNKKREREELKHNPTSKTFFLKHLKMV